MAYTLQPSFCKVGYMPVSVQFLNSIQDNTILMRERVTVVTLSVCLSVCVSLFDFGEGVLFRVETYISTF